MLLYKPKLNFVAKSNNAICSAVKNTSCSRGWLRVLVQALFCIITAVSFILILVMSIQRSPYAKNHDYKPGVSRKCVVSGCRIICSQAPFDRDYEEEITYAISMVFCEDICLTLNRPMFVNGSLPINWLSRINANIVELCIVGGNLKYIPPNAFMSSFTCNVETLVLEDITITDWEPDMLVGLLQLTKLHIRYSRVMNVQRNALRAVDETLQRLSIITSGFFNPANITGSSVLTKLTEVFLTANNFSNILGPESFRELIFCRELYLTSSKITAIQAGTFDSMAALKILFLNNNLLQTLPSGIFGRIAMNPNPNIKIDLHENPWYCNCQLEHIRELNKVGFIILEPTCNGPDRFAGMPFSKIKSFCSEKHKNKTNDNAELIDFNNGIEAKVVTDSIYMDGNCHTNNSYNYSKTMSPIIIYNCSDNRIEKIDLQLMNYISQNAPMVSSEFKPSFLIYSPQVSMVEINMEASLDYGLIWFQSACPDEIYCVRTIPTHLRIYNVDIDNSYTICPVHDSGVIKTNSCITFNPSNGDLSQFRIVRVRIYVFVMAVFVAGGVGAILVYGVIRQHPILLKGSKRIFIVKSKTSDALILPPKVPLRQFPLENVAKTTYKKDNLFAVPPRPDLLSPISRSSSIRSFKSSAPSYVSAIQPTEDQLLEWRLKQHFNNEPFNSSDTISCIYDGGSLYHSIHSSSDHIYETPRCFTNERL